MTVRLERPAQGVAEIVLDRPGALNAVSTELAEAIVAACRQLSGDATVQAVVLSSGVERAFCVGADLKERAAFTADELAAQRPVTRAAYRSVLDLAMPTVAAVEGYALGGGCELALACDLIVASETAVFGLPEVTVGLVPGGGGTQLLQRRLGTSRAADLIFTGRRVAVDEADRLGLVDRRVAAGAARSAARELAGQIAAQSPVALRQAKWALRAGADRDLASALEIEDQAWRQAAAADDRVEGIAAFSARRAPRWPGPPTEPAPGR